MFPAGAGFNLQGRFAMPDRPYSGLAYEESEFASMAKWGFDFARLPLSYWAWGSRDDWSVIREQPSPRSTGRSNSAAGTGSTSTSISTAFQATASMAVSWNRRTPFPHGCTAGQGPGRCRLPLAGVRPALQGIPNRHLSFDLVNEPTEDEVVRGDLRRALRGDRRALPAGIREIDPARLIFADGLDIGQTPVAGIADLALSQSTRGYLPKAVSHYTADWVPRDEFESFAAPAWPFKDQEGRLWDRERPSGDTSTPPSLVERGVQWGRSGVGCVQQDAPLRCPLLDGRQPLALEGGRLGIRTLEPARELRSARQRALGRPVRKLQGPQARPEDARTAPEVLSGCLAGQASSHGR